MLGRVAGHPADEVGILPAPTQEKEEDLTNSISLFYKPSLAGHDSCNLGDRDLKIFGVKNSGSVAKFY